MHLFVVYIGIKPGDKKSPGFVAFDAAKGVKDSLASRGSSVEEAVGGYMLQHVKSSREPLQSVTDISSVRLGDLEWRVVMTFDGTVEIQLGNLQIFRVLPHAPETAMAAAHLAVKAPDMAYTLSSLVGAIRRSPECIDDDDDIKPYLDRAESLLKQINFMPLLGLQDG